MNEKSLTVEGYKFLDRDEYKEHQGYFQNLTERIRFIGDVDLLQYAHQDIKKIRSISAREGEYRK